MGIECAHPASRAGAIRLARRVLLRVGTTGGEVLSHPGKEEAAMRFKSKDKKRPMVLTIYDYKDERPLNEVNQWHVGLKGDAHQVDQLLREKGLYAEALEIHKKYR